MSFDSPLEFLQSHEADDPGPLASAALKAGQADRATAAAEERERADRNAQREARMEALALADRQAGHPREALREAQLAAGQAADRVAGLEEELSRAQRKLRTAEANIIHFAERAQVAYDVASRSAPLDVPGDLLGPAKQAHAKYVRASRAAWQASAAGPVNRGPKGVISRSHGDAVRSEDCAYCTQAGVDDETSYLLHSDPQFNVPVTSPEQAREAEQAERYRRDSHGVAVR